MTTPADEPHQAAAPRPRWQTVTWLVAAAVGSTGLFVVTYLVAVRTRRGRLMDGASLRGAAQSSSSVTDVVERLLDVVSVASLLVAALSLVVIALLRLRRDLAVAAVVVVVGSNLTTQLLKLKVLSRPDLGLSETTPATLNSLPSGHTTVAFSVSVALVLVCPARLRPVVAVVGTIYASATALATLSAGWHRPSDSLAAFFVVTAWAAATQAVVVLRRPIPDGQQPTGTGRARTARQMARIAGYLVAFSALLAIVVVVTRLDVYGTLAQVSTYIASACAMAGTATALMAGVLLITAPERTEGLVE